MPELSRATSSSTASSAPGLCREVTSEYADIINAINASGAYVISADIPSGLSSDSGQILGTAVRADKTVAIAELKAGFALASGFDCCGTVVVKDIGICPDEGGYAAVYDDSDIAKFYPRAPAKLAQGHFRHGNACVRQRAVRRLGRSRRIRRAQIGLRLRKGGVHRRCKGGQSRPTFRRRCSPFSPTCRRAPLQSVWAAALRRLCTIR